jgi:hypothetical protein
MPIGFPCEQCRQQLRVKDELAGKKVKCPACGQIVLVPSLTAAPAPVVPVMAAVIDPQPRRPRGVKPAIAEAIVRRLAQKHKAKGVLKRLGNFEEDYLEKARSSFAQDLEDDEIPLVRIDTSFFKTGKAGLLLTNRTLYSSFLESPMPLEEITDVVLKKPTAFEHFMLAMFGLWYVMFHGQLKSKLLVNDEVAYEGQLNVRYAFWTEVLTDLAEASRQ